MRTNALDDNNQSTNVPVDPVVMATHVVPPIVVVAAAVVIEVIPYPEQYAPY
jgi:hypothetical protein